MNGEDELRATLTERAPSGVDTTGWADAARTRAARTRHRTIAATAAVLTVLLGAGLVGLLTNGTRQSTLPVHPRPTTTVDEYAALCAKPFDGTGPIWGEFRPSERYTAMALCPATPGDPAWKELPVPALVRGAYMDGLAGDGGGPPVENCEGGRPSLPSFRVVARGRDGLVTVHAGATRCLGAQLAQSFAVALARQQYDIDGSGNPACAGWWTGPSEGQRVPGRAGVDVCVVGDPYTEAEPAPLRYRPVHAWHPDPTQEKVLANALSRASEVRDKFTQCPWRHVAVKVVAVNSAGKQQETFLFCDQDYSVGGVDGATRMSTMRGKWQTLPAPALQLLEEQVAAYLAGTATD